jgi:hypothetical protein
LAQKLHKSQSSNNSLDLSLQLITTFRLLLRYFKKGSQMKNILLFLFFTTIILLGSCRKDFSTQRSSGSLEFSKDTVYLDTVFTNIGSSTYSLKVYNRSNDAITIPTIQLEQGEDSGYRLNVDGIPGKYFEDIDILAKDSIYIFIETTIDYSQVTNPLYEDKLQFDSGSNLQEVPLVTLVQDAHFLYPDRENGIIETLLLGTNPEGEEIRIEGRYLADDELTFTNEKPYVIYGYMAVGDADNTAKTLTVEAGSKVYFHANSGLIVNKNSSLHINGSLNIEGQPETEVTFEGDRLEPEYAEVAGQWGLIWLREGSIDNQINYATIKNGSVGLLVDGMLSTATPTLHIQNSQIYNLAQFGILGRNTHIKGENLVINNAGFSSLAGTSGGVYNFTHATFANYWNGTRSYPTVLLNNFYAIDENTVMAVDLQEATFTNCIIDGRNNIELNLEKVDGADFNYQFINNIIAFNDIQNSYTDNPLYNFTDSSHYTDNLINADSDFREPTQNDLIIGEDSEGNGQAATSGSLLVPLDLLGVPRNNPADIGAYEHIIFE